MATESIVFESDMTQADGLDRRIPKDKRNVGYHPDDVDKLLEYSDRKFKGDVASVLPLSDDMGRIPGGNLFGRIVMGRSFRGEDMHQEPLVPEVVNDFKRLAEEGDLTKRGRKKTDPQEEAAAREAKAALLGESEDGEDDDPPPRKRRVFVPEVREEIYTDEELEPLVPSQPVTVDDVEMTPLQFPGTPKDVESVFERIMSANPPPEDVPPAPAPATPSVEIKIETPWCDVDGKYVDVVVSDSIVVLVADPRFNVFTPKASNQKLVVRAGQDAYDVVYYGMSYEYEGNVHQVYVRK